VADRPLRPATHRRLGGPLPRQQANGPRAHPRPEAEATFGDSPAGPARHQALASVSTGYSCVLGRLPTCYSPVRRSSTPEGAFPLDLHVLGTPPAFVLSQDQTLREQVAKTASPAVHQKGSDPGWCGGGIVGRSLTMKESLRPDPRARSALKGRRTHRRPARGPAAQDGRLVFRPPWNRGADEPDVDRSGVTSTPQRSPNC
jgi:hypothetical protein